MAKNDDDIFSLILESQKQEKRTPVDITRTRPGASDFSDWAPKSEGRLAIDVYDVDDAIVVVAPMAGVDPGDVDVHIHEDMLSIRGKRKKPALTGVPIGQYHAECYWGPFSRSIVLPADVSSGTAVAEYTHGLLTIRIPKKKTTVGRTIPIEIVEE